MTLATTAIVLAAGRGERLRPHTDHCPKPLLPVRGKPLIEWHLEALARAGVRQVVVNTAWLEDQFPPALGDGSRWGLTLHYSMEQRDHGGALETAGGIAKALRWLADPFWVVSGDVFVPGFDFGAETAARLVPGDLAHLWMAPNPAHHAAGDFVLTPEGRLRPGASGAGGPTRTWASVGLFRPAMFDGIVPGTRMALRPRLERAMAEDRLGGSAWDGEWTDVGTPPRWAALEVLA